MACLARRILSCVIVPVLLAPGCTRPDDELPPPIPVPGAAAAASPRGTPPAPPAEHSGDPDEPQAPPGGPPGGPSAPASPGAAPSASGTTPLHPAPTIPFTPYPIPFPLTLPQGFPGIPGLPALPAFPGAPGAPAPTAPAGPAAPNAPRSQPQADARVVVYGANWCGACKALRRDLEARKVPYSYVDVDDPKSPKGDIPANMRGGIPVTRVTQRSGKTVWVQGADGARIEQAYRA